MKMITRSVSSLSFVTLIVACGFVFSTGIGWTKYDFRCLAGYVPNETLFQADDVDSVTCGKMCYLTNQCLGVFYQPDTRRCTGSRVELWTNRYEELPGSIHFSKNLTGECPNNFGEKGVCVELRRGGREHDRLMYIDTITCHMKNYQYFMAEEEPSGFSDLLTNCRDILESDPTAASGVYNITIGGIPGTFYCDMTTDGGGWTVFQRRFEGNVDFQGRTLSEYENGFGDIDGDYWLGLRYIQMIADKYPSELKLEFTSVHDVAAYEHYEKFRLLNGKKYRLFVDGLSTNITDPSDPLQDNFFKAANGSPFTTDRGKDPDVNCPFVYGGWWNTDCVPVNLNGLYCHPHCDPERAMLFHNGLIESGGKALKATRMLLRPKKNC